jgi:hypothetical protein
MTYYRIALQNRQSTTWAWKTTVLTSLSAVFQLLKIYRSVPQYRIRVFTASTKEQLDEMLCLENSHRVSGSSTAAQFLLARKLSIPGITHDTPEQVLTEREIVVQPVRQEIAIAAGSALRGSSSSTVGSFNRGGMSLLERRRLELEDGPGGDHDTSYRFTLPPTTPQMLAWIRLRARVQEGELTP